MSIEKVYIEKYKLDEWFFDDYQDKQLKIRFSDRIEYKLNGVYHNIYDAAIKFLSNSGIDQFYIHGKHFKDKVEWESEAIKLSRKSKIRNLFKEE
jgi:hypothetical protein